MQNKVICQELVAEALLTSDQARVAVHAKFRCEYCDLPFLESAENYKQWQWDHIVPKNSDGADTFDNLAAACWTCNVRFKSTWNPESVAGQNAPREKLVAAVREYICKKKKEVKIYVERYKSAIKRGTAAADV